MLKVQNLNVAYDATQVLWDVSLEVAKGETVAILGPNGAGKSTLLNTIAGLNRCEPKSKISYLDREIQNEPAEKIVNEGISLAPQGGWLFLMMDVRSNLELGAYMKRGREDMEKNLQFVYGLFPVLKEREHQLCRTLSGGERQMVTIGRALMSKPNLLLLDEISSGLAPIVTERIFDSLVKLRETGLTMLVAEQSVATALGVSSRAYILTEGKIALERKSDELAADPKMIDAYLGI